MRLLPKKYRRWVPLAEKASSGKKNREWFPLAEKAPSGENNGKRFPLVEKTASSGKKIENGFLQQKNLLFLAKKIKNDYH